MLLGHGGHFVWQHDGGNGLAFDFPVRVDLAEGPVRVLVRRLGTVQCQVDPASSGESRAKGSECWKVSMKLVQGRGTSYSRPLWILIVTSPCLLHIELSTGPTEGEARRCRAARGPVVRAVVRECAVEEVGQLAARGTARRGDVWDGGVGEVEAGVAPRVLMGRRAKNVRGVEVKVLDGPLEVVEGFVGAAW